jgi:hypothetical protein
MPDSPPIAASKTVHCGQRRALLAAFFLGVGVLPVLGMEDPWGSGCPNCTVIDPPSYMASAIAGFDVAAKREGIADDLVGPACRAIPIGDWSVCRFAFGPGCGSLDVAGQHGVFLVASFGALVTVACPDGPARSFERATVHGLLRCRDPDATAAATAILLDNALDLSTPEKLAAFEATHPSGERLPPNIEIATTCGTMSGARIIEPADGGTRERITLNRLAD